MTSVTRRTFIKGAAAGAGVAVAGPFQGVAARAATVRNGGTVRASAPHPGYGPLIPTPDLRDGTTRLALPEGFSYRSFAPRGFVMDDGVATPARHDGMACFNGPGRNFVLIRNHEVNGPVPAFGDPATAYDTMTGGGTTRVVITRFGEVLHSEVSCNGTQMNCSGGPMLWGSWISCEETVNGPDVGPDFTGAPNTALTQTHGYVHEVRARANGAVKTTPVRSAGRFAHESVAYDPFFNHLYLTEDNFAFPSGFYRYRPPDHALFRRRISDGGRLQMLAVKGQPNADLSGHFEIGTTFDTEWVTIDDPDPTFAPGTTNDQALVAVSNQGLAKGAAMFSRLEGSAWDLGVVYFTSTQGGALDPSQPPPAGFGDGRGQIWAYRPLTGRLRLVYESTGLDVLDLPDNVTTSRRGSLVICEDGLDGQSFLRGLTPGGLLFDFAQNVTAGTTGDEFAGSTFSPDGHTLFVNIQSSFGISFAIWGPWAKGGF
ncbi:MAG: PhoX family protein [Sporichthyaceae bacterium]|nr:PhoX family protein [Sporichthyaceae bacterium]